MSDATIAIKTNSFSGLIANFAPQWKKSRLWHRIKQTGCHLFKTTLICTLKLEFEQSYLCGTF